jgi:hypothetical protein
MVAREDPGELASIGGAASPSEMVAGWSEPLPPDEVTHRRNGMRVEGTDDGHGFGVSGETTFTEPAHPEIPKLRVGVIGVAGTIEQVFIDDVLLKTISIRTAGVAGLTTLKADSVGVYGATETNEGQNPTFGFLAGPNPLSAQQLLGAFGQSDSVGVFGFGSTPGSTGVHGNTAFGAGTGIWGNTSTGIGVLGTSAGAGLAGRFEGNVEVTGHLNAQHGTVTCFDVALVGGDCAEEFDIHGIEHIEPGTVMVLNDLGALEACAVAYDMRVAGVISGAGDYKPGIVLDKQQSRHGRQPIALLGKVFCKVDAQYAAIQTGDLMTTSPTPGHAMRAADRERAFGAVIGKAIRPLAAGRGLIPVLIALQ